MADGYTTAGAQDGYMYVFGRGKSATTVSAPQTTIAKGTDVLITGTVTDLSPAQSGTPCVSRASMTTQMEHLHIQLPIDGIYHNVTMTGVPVTLTAIDSVGNVIDLGTVTTNPYYGTFSAAWTPPAEGVYTVTASFLGDDSYGSSGAATAVSIGSAPAEIQIPEQIVPPDYTMAIIEAAVAVIAAVFIAVAAAVMILRKRA
jgi:hypothetical protein